MKQIIIELEKWCADHHIPTASYTYENAHCLAVPAKNFKPVMEQVKLRSVPARLYLEHSTRHNKSYIIMSPGEIDTNQILDSIDESAQFQMRLDEVLQSESQHKRPTTAFRRKSALNQFRDSIADRDKEPAKPAKPAMKNVEEAIEEALEGIATPDDVQPQEGLKSLLAAMKNSGLDKSLKKAEVTWRIAEPGKHAITFLKGKIPILQMASLDLADPKELAATLAQLTSIAQGKAPQAAEIELNIAKEKAAKANDRQKALDDIANQVVQQNVPVRANEAQLKAAQKLSR